MGASLLKLPKGKPNINVSSRGVPNINIASRGLSTQIHENVNLMNCTYDNTRPFIPPITTGKVIKVYDGDTIHVACEVWKDNIYRFSVRMRGYDSAEIRTRNKAEKKAAYEAKEALENKVLGQIVRLENVALEKYGRVLADVFFMNEHINQWMIDNKYGIKYDGGTKIKVDWATYRK